jgi:hypothetical protein
MLGALLLVGDDGEKLQNFTDPICTKSDITIFKVGWRLTYLRHKLWAGLAQSVQRLSYGLDGPGIESRWG